MLPHQAAREGHPNNIIPTVQGSYNTVSEKKLKSSEIGFLNTLFQDFITISSFGIMGAAVHTSRIKERISQTPARYAINSVESIIVKILISLV